MKKLLALCLLFSAPQLFAQPGIGELLRLHESIVQISVELGNGNAGTGTGVVISPEYVVTNCHVLANGKGANVAKYNDGYIRSEKGEYPDVGYPEAWLRRVIKERPNQFRLPAEPPAPKAAQ